MLTNATMMAFLPTTKPSQSEGFYKNTLGLNLISEDNYALEFEGNGVTLRVTIVENFEPHPFAVLGFKIKTIEAQVKILNGKGVTFERYDSLNQDESGIWTSPSKAKIAWFKDPDGNLISLTEYAS